MSAQSPTTTAPTDPGTRIGPVLIAAAVGTAVIIGLGVYGRVHTPSEQPFFLGGLASPLVVKSALTSVAFAFALVQLVTAMALYGRLPLSGRWVAPVHRWSGRVAVLVTVPVAVHCLYALGFQTFDARVAVHSIVGCFFYGAFVAKMLLLRRDDAPPWALPLLGGLVFSALTALWLTASLWLMVVTA